ncbi:uncharacterized protein LOC126591563 [Malus sylvestris]|uniref:uncharacterized protein LOC126591563 n=1 Tax=Malus sylvestris TaxID=3752 RepID=UPI0021AC6F4A|nr:uncharacterized protein LOC126591563 [Malus sylvestris]XP_050113262.1 uncharacterized protein LOC126591563 [Malus sylvestris]
MKDIVELALKMFKAQKGIKGKKNINSKVVKCPLQEGTVECGYYVMKYMKEIIDDPNCSIITKDQGTSYLIFLRDGTSSPIILYDEDQEIAGSNLIKEIQVLYILVVTQDKYNK